MNTAESLKFKTTWEEQIQRKRSQMKVSSIGVTKLYETTEINNDRKQLEERYIEALLKKTKLTVKKYNVLKELKIV